MASGAGAVVAPATARAHIQAWLTEFVVGLNLCPFARPVLLADSLRIEICNLTDSRELLNAFLLELDLLQRSSEAQIATTLLVFPMALGDFQDYLDFLDDAQALLAEAGLEGVVQLASFHPHYQFAAEPASAPSHYSNRSPYPVIHFLREDMLSRVLAEGADPDEVPLRNIATLDTIGSKELQRRWGQLFRPA